MRIGISAYVNPYELREYLNTGQEVPYINPSATSVNNIALGLLRKGHKLIIITSTVEKMPLQQLHGSHLDIYIVSSAPVINKTGIFLRWYMVKRLRKVIKAHVHEMDVLHAHWAYDFTLAATAFTSTLPVFCTVRDWGPIMCHYATGLQKLSWTCVSVPVFKRVLKSHKIHFVANSRYIHHLIQTYYPNDLCDIIENPVKQRFIIEQRASYPKDPVFVSVSQLLTDPRKNITSLLRAFHLLRNERAQARLILVGQCDVTSAIYQQWERGNLLEGVTLSGFLNHDKLMGLLDSVSALVHPSLEESFGNTLLEGMARRLPVIGGSASGAIPYVLGQGKYGLLCDVTSPNDIKEKLIQSLDIGTMQPILDAATTYLEKDLNEDVISERHIRLYSRELCKFQTN